MTTGTAVASRSGMPGAGRAPKRGSGDPRPYDFRRPSKLNREHVRGLQIAYETFARQLTTVLTSTLRVISQMSLVSVQQMTYAEYIESLPVPSFMAIVGLDPLPGAGILQFQHDIAMTCIDRLLGGPGRTQQPERSFTEIEAGLLRTHSQRMAHELRYAFEGLVRVEPTVLGLEESPQFAQVAAPSDVMVTASFEMRVGEADGVATLSLPFSALIPVLEAAVTTRRADRHADAARSAALMSTRMNDVPLDVSLQFSPVALTPREIVDLAIGDILPLGHRTSDPLRVNAGTVTFAYAVPGARGKRLACLVVEEPNAKEGDAQ